MATLAPICTVCGGSQFSQRGGLWDQLIRDWQLSPDEAEYINRQQALMCDVCGANLRSVALADAIRAYLRTTQFLNEAVCADTAQQLALLEINEAGTLSPHLRKLRGHVFAAYPEVDIHALPYADGTFDAVVHSDTLEHVANPTHALRECRRVLKVGGALCFTIPLIVGRMTRSRAGLSRSYHSDPTIPADDLTVVTEFGADAWTFLFAAGFTEIALHAVAYPASVAFRATRT